MANLKSYSCPKCGSFLDVDRDQDIYTCPFCGSVFDVVDFHGKEIFDQAAEFAHRKEYKKAREKYEFLLSKKPFEFDFLYGYACAVGEVDTLDDLESAKNLSSSVRNLFQNDPKYLVGPSAAYFAKLLEMFNTTKEILDKKQERDKLANEAESNIKNINKEQEFFNAGIGIYSVIHYVVGAVILLCISNEDFFHGVLGTLLLSFYAGFPLLLFMISYSAHMIKKGRNAEDLQARLEPFKDMKKRADALSDEIEKLERYYENCYKVLPRLKPQSSKFLEPAPVNRDPRKSEVTADPKRAVICKKCCAVLTHDKERKLYICSHCGVNYDFSTFIGNDITKANTHLKNREFKMADAWFAKSLESDPGNFDANRGRILCAGKWIGFLEVKLNDKLEQVDWDGVMDALDDAINNSNEFNKSYFTELKGLLDNVKEYYDTCSKMEGDGNNDQLPILIQKRDWLAKEYSRIFREFIEYEKKHRIANSNDISEAADKMLAYRLRIIEGTLWGTIEAADPDVIFVPGRKYGLMSLIKEAMGMSKDEYYYYFNLWGKFIDEFVSYSLFHMKHKQLKAKEEELDLENNTEDWTVLKETISKYDGEAEGRKKKYDELYNELIEMDRKLFLEKDRSIEEAMENGES